jgi:hypothetical protein
MTGRPFSLVEYQKYQLDQKYDHFLKIPGVEKTGVEKRCLTLKK